MEDAATAEISRAQIWQWKHHGVQTEDDGVVITAKRISNLVREEVARRTGGEDRGKWFLAGKLVSTLCTFSAVNEIRSHSRHSTHLSLGGRHADKGQA
jgi:malate synthase